MYLATCPPGHLFSFGLTVNLKLVGVIMWGRPTNNYFQDGYTIQGYRLATDHSHKNSGSMLIARAVRVARLLGYKRAIAYVRADFQGVQVRACGFSLVKSGIRARNGDCLNLFELSLV